MRTQSCRWLIAVLSCIFACSAAAENLLRVGAQRFADTLGNPYTTIALPNVLVAQAIYDPLTRVGAEGKIEPGLAVSWRQDGPNTWIFQLRPGITFSNGEPFDAAALVAAFEYLGTDQGRRDAIAHQDIKTTIASFKARDPLTFEIVTVEPDPILPLHMSFLRVPAPRRWAEVGREAFQRVPVGTGPFKVDSWEEARLEMSAFTGSWRAPKVDRLRILQIGDPTVRLQAFSSNAVDIAMALSPQDEPDVQAVGGRLLSRPSPLTNFVMFVTTRDTPLKDVRVRRALNYAANKEVLLKTFLNNAITPATQFSHPMAFGFNPDLKAYPYDPAKARALLAEAGYAKGFAFTMLIEPSSGGSYLDWFQQLAQDFAAVGVTMTIRPITQVRLMDSILQGKWQADAFSFSFAGFDSLRAYKIRSCSFPTAYHCDPGMTPLIAAAQAAPTAEARLAATRAVVAYERDNPPGVLLWQGVAFDGVSARVADFSVDDDVISWDRIRLK